MTRWQWFLVGMVLAQLISIASLAMKKGPSNIPPFPEVDRIDAVSAKDLEVAHRNTRSDSADELTSLAEMYFAHGFYPEAEACYARAVELAPNEGEYHFDHGFCLAHAGRVEEAVVAYERALEAGVRKPKAVRYFLGRCYLRLNQLDKAHQTLTSIGDLPAADFELARIAARSGKAAAASQRFKQLCKGNEEAAEYWYWASRTTKAAGDEKAAEMMADHAARALSRGDTPFSEQSQRWYQVLESFGLAQRRIDVQDRFGAGELLGLDERTDDLLQVEWYFQGEDTLAELDLQQNDPAAALKRLRRVLNWAGPTLDRYWRIGDALAMNNQPDEAEAAWYKALELGGGKYSDLAGLHQTLAEWQAMTRNNETAAAEHRAKALYFKGLDSFANAEYEKAIPALSESLRQSPKNAQGWFYLGEARRLTASVNPPAPGETAKAAYDRCLQLNPDHGRAIQALTLIDP